MHLYRRACKIIKIIYDKQNELDIKDLAQILNVSTKTIQADIQEVNEFLKSTGIASLKEKENKFYITKVQKSIDEILSTLSFYDYKLSKDERLIIEALLLIFTKNHVTLFNVAEFMYVSRSTVIGDIKYLNRFLGNYHLSIDSQTNTGIKIRGSEESIRNLFVNILFKHRDLYNLFSHQEKIKNMKFGELKAIDVERNIILQNLISEAEKYSEMQLTEHSFNILWNYLCMVIVRIRSGKYLKNYKSESGEVSNKLIERLYTLVFQHFDLKENENELYYLNNFSKSLTYLKKNNTTDGSKEIVKIQTITRLFIMKVSKALNIPLYKDYELFKSLSNHLERIFLDGFTSLVDNYEINFIIGKYSYVKSKVEENIGVLEQYAKRPIGDEEIAYIVIYICASIEKIKIHKNRCNVILVCNSGIGTSQFLKSKLLDRFNLNIVNVLPKHRLKDSIRNDIDFIISTVDLDETCLPYIRVSPQLTDSDFLRMRKMIEDYGSVNFDEIHDNNCSEIMKKIELIIKDDEILDVIRKSLNEYFDKKNKVNLSLADLLTEDFIQLDVKVEGWKDAIKKASQNLLDKGFITNEYVKSIIKNTIENGPYYVISKGFAIPHSEIGDGGKIMGFNLIRLREPVMFNAGIYDPIKYICIINAVDKERHLNALFNLINLLQISEFKKALDKSKSSKEMARTIELYERRIQ